MFVQEKVDVDAPKPSLNSMKSNSILQYDYITILYIYSFFHLYFDTLFNKRQNAFFIFYVMTEACTHLILTLLIAIALLLFQAYFQSFSFC